MAHNLSPFNQMSLFQKKSLTNHEVLRGLWTENIKVLYERYRNKSSSKDDNLEKVTSIVENRYIPFTLEEWSQEIIELSTIAQRFVAKSGIELDPISMSLSLKE